jgi:beta-glucosidase
MPQQYPALEQPPKNALYRQSTAPVDQRVEDLLGRMTLDEKIGQMALVEKNSMKNPDDVRSYGIGAMLSGMGGKPENNTPEGWFEMVRTFKNSALQSRLGIPLLYGADAVHGNGNVPGATIFPHEIGLGATGDGELVKRVASATAKEMAAVGINWSFSPALDLPKDIRWGRVYESFSDDPGLSGTLGAAYVKGTQEISPSSTHVLATAKHYVAPGSMAWGTSSNKNYSIDQGRTPADEKILDEVYLPPFKAAVDAGVSSVMIGLNSWDDTWVSYQTHLITDKLKGELGFKGFTVSDWYGVYEHAPTQYDGLVKSINAGVDMIMLPFDYKGFVMNMRLAVKSGDISESRIDDAVRRILRAKFNAGLFDQSLVSSMDADVVGSTDHRVVARKAVTESFVLLKNEHRVLPISSSVNHLLIAGSAADNIGRQAGAWTVEWQGIDGNLLPGATSILQGIRQSVSSSTKVEFEVGARFASSTHASIGIAVVGEKPYAEGWGDNANPSLTQEDLETIARLKSHCDRVVVILISGRPLMISDDLKQWDGLIAAWLPGSEGEGIADALFGRAPFTGKLPLPWPANVNQLPISIDGKTADGSKVLFPRGFGL